MLKLSILPVLAMVILIQTVPAYCDSKTMEVSATVPEHVMADSGLTAFSNNPNQLVQTQTIIRNNKSINLTSIVVP